MRDDWLFLLPLFQDLSSFQREQLRQLFMPVDFICGKQLFEQGDRAEFLYLVVSGEVTIRYKPEDGSEITVTRVKPGGIVGWSAALGNRCYTSGAVCSSYSQLLRVRGNDLRELCTRCPQTGEVVLERLATVIAERLSSTHDEVMALLKQGLENGVKKTRR